MNAEGTNIKFVVIADLHICVRSRRDDVEKFCDFLNELSSKTSDKINYHLVVAGDFFNLDLIIRENTNYDPRCTIKAILDSFPCISRSIASFLIKGNRISFIAGNHDIELFHPDVSALFTSAVVQHIPDEYKFCILNLDFSSPEFMRIGEEVHIEHGNRFDSDNTFDGRTFSDVKRGRKIYLPLGSCIERKLLSKIPYLDYSGFFNKTPFPLLRTVIGRHGFFVGFSITFRYLWASILLIIESIERRVNRSYRRCVEYMEGAIPTMSSPLKTLRRLYFDRTFIFIFFIIWVISIPVILLVSPFMVIICGVMFLLFGIFVFAEGNRYKEFNIISVRRGASTLVRTIGVSLVILAHSHVAELREMKNFVYANTGAFTESTASGCPYIEIEEREGQFLVQLKFYR